MLKKLVNLCGSLFIIALLGNIALKSTNIWINTSPSLPKGIYHARPIDSLLQHGDLVLSCIPKIFAHYAYERGYLMHGKCQGDVAPIGKHVAATAGDEVEISAQGITVNGQLLPHTACRERDGQGRDMISIPLHRKLKDDEIILANNTDTSFDSRYFGVLHRSSIIYKIEPLWTVSG